MLHLRRPSGYWKNNATDAKTLETSGKVINKKKDIVHGIWR